MAIDGSMCLKGLNERSNDCQLSIAVMGGLLLWGGEVRHEGTSPDHLAVSELFISVAI